MVLFINQFQISKKGSDWDHLLLLRDYPDPMIFFPKIGILCSDFIFTPILWSNETISTEALSCFQRCFRNRHSVHAFVRLNFSHAPWLQISAKEIVRMSPFTEVTKLNFWSSLSYRFAKISQSLKEEQKLGIYSNVCWKDSAFFLHWINSSDQPFNEKHS